MVGSFGKAGQLEWPGEETGKGRASERMRRGQRRVENRSLKDEGNWSGVI